jgi:hypothetical protein
LQIGKGSTLPFANQQKKNQKVNPPTKSAHHLIIQEQIKCKSGKIQEQILNSTWGEITTRSKNCVVKKKKENQRRGWAAYKSAGRCRPARNCARSSTPAGQRVAPAWNCRRGSALAGQRVLPAWNCRHGSAPARQRVEVQGTGDEERLPATTTGSPWRTGWRW